MQEPWVYVWHSPRSTLYIGIRAAAVEGSNHDEPLSTGGPFRETLDLTLQVHYIDLTL